MIKNSSTPATGLVVLAFLAVYFIWGSTYLGIRIAIETLPPLTMAGVRFLLAGSILYAFGMRRGWGKPTREHWRNALIIGGLLLMGGNGLVTWSEQYLESSLAAVLVATVPLWIVLLEWLRSKNYPGHQVILGLMLGFGGVVFLVGPANLSGNGSINLLGVGAIMIATFSWANGSLYSRRAAMPQSPLLAVSMEMLCGGALLLVAGLVTGEASDLALSEVSARSIWALLYLTIFGSMVAFTAYVWLLKVTTPARAATYAYVNPVIAVLLGWSLGNEAINSSMLIAATMIIGAVVMITTHKAKHSTSKVETPIVTTSRLAQDTN